MRDHRCSLGKLAFEQSHPVLKRYTTLHGMLLKNPSGPGWHLKALWQANLKTGAAIGAARI